MRTKRSHLTSSSSSWLQHRRTSAQWLTLMGANLCSNWSTRGPPLTRKIKPSSASRSKSAMSRLAGLPTQVNLLPEVSRRDQTQPATLSCNRSTNGWQSSSTSCSKSGARHTWRWATWESWKTRTHLTRIATSLRVRPSSPPPKKVVSKASKRSTWCWSLCYHWSLAHSSLKWQTTRNRLTSESTCVWPTRSTIVRICEQIQHHQKMIHVTIAEVCAMS